MAATALTLTTMPVAAQESVVAALPEFRVNTTTTGNQQHPVVALAADGSFIVVWSSQSGQPATTGIYAQRYDAGGDELMGEFRLNSTTTGVAPARPTVAVEADGDFVVAWQLITLVSGPNVIYAQRFSALGDPEGPELLVTPISTTNAVLSSVGVDADGDFVVVWNRTYAAASNIYAQRYSSAGAALGGLFRVNTDTAHRMTAPVVGMDADGDFVVVWESSGQDGSYAGVYGQRYDATGAPQGGEFRVNTYTTANQYSPAIAMNADGSFVVAWSGQQDAFNNDGYSVHARRYSAAGVELGDEFKVNTYTTGTQRYPSVVADADGNFIVAWQSGAISGPTQDGSGEGIYAQRYTVGGAPVGTEFRVNTRTPNDQFDAAVGMDADGDVVVAWTSDQQDGSTGGIYAARFEVEVGAAVEPGVGTGLALTVAPSPVVGATGRVQYTLPEAGAMRLAVYDALGREVAVLADGTVAAGAHEAALNGAGLAPGVYVVRLAAGDETLTRRVTVAR